MAKFIIILGITLILSFSTAYGQSFKPNVMTVDTIVNVIDSAACEVLFNDMRPTIERTIENLKKKKQSCQDLLNSNNKKVNSKEDLSLISEAYEYSYKAYTQLKRYETKNRIILPMVIPFVGGMVTGDVNNSGNGQTVMVKDKDVEKGKLSANVRKYLSYYSACLQETIYRAEKNLSDDWMSFIDTKSTKLDTIQINNRFYRGNHYNSADMLDKIEFNDMIKGWEFLYSDKGEHRSETYPNIIYYETFPDYPSLRVTTRDNYLSDKNYKEVYDKNGHLVYVPVLSRKNGKAIFWEIKRQIYQKDFQRNKYKVNSESAEVRKHISYDLSHPYCEQYTAYISNSWLPETKKYIEEKYKSIASAYINPYHPDTKKAKAYIGQLQIDHSDELGFVYMIERVSDLAFRVVYINKETLKSSVCAIVTFRTAAEPYTSTFSVRLERLPANVPEVIKK